MLWWFLNITLWINWYWMNLSMITHSCLAINSKGKVQFINIVLIHCTKMVEKWILVKNINYTCHFFFLVYHFSIWGSTYFVANLHNPWTLIVWFILNSSSYSCKAFIQLTLHSPNSFCINKDFIVGWGVITFAWLFRM